VAADKKSGFPTMAHLVAPYAAALTEHARSRPYALVGHSFAGLLAFETAREVQRRGGNVELVILLDTWARPPSAHQIAWHSWRRLWAELDRGSTARLARSIASRLRSSWRTTRWLLAQQKGRIMSFFGRFVQDRSVLTTILDEDGKPVPEVIVSRAYVEIARAYAPHPLD
jgi:thioesterase domain-containing protein